MPSAISNYSNSHTHHTNIIPKISESDINETIIQIRNGKIRSINLPNQSVNNCHFVRLVEAICLYARNDFGLYLAENNITAEGLEAVTTILGENKTITTIDLSFNDVGVHGINAFLEIFKTNFTITTLNIGDQNIPKTLMDELAKKVSRNITIQSEYNHEKERIKDGYYISLFKQLSGLEISRDLCNLIIEYSTVARHEKAISMLPPFFYLLKEALLEPIREPENTTIEESAIIKTEEPETSSSGCIMV